MKNHKNAGAQAMLFQSSPKEIFLQKVIDGVPDALMVIDDQYRVILANRAALEFIGSEGGLDAQTTCYQLSHQLAFPCSAAGHPCPLAQVRRCGQTISVIHEHFQVDGQRRLIEVNAAPFHAEDGSFQGIIEFMHDITEKAQAEQERQRYRQNLQALTVQLAEVTEAERQRLSRELHDRVGRNLTALGINLNIMRSKLLDPASTDLQLCIEDSLGLVSETTEVIRNVMADLRPPVLDDYGLVPALDWYGQEFSRRTQLSFSIKGQEPHPRLPARVENTLFRIGQEALNNVAKHAQATKVQAVVETEKNMVRLIIVDNGIGFDLNQVKSRPDCPGWGLMTMTERAEGIGGRCRIKSQPGKGTQVIVEVLR